MFKYLWSVKSVWLNILYIFVLYAFQLRDTWTCGWKIKTTTEYSSWDLGMKSISHYKYHVHDIYEEAKENAILLTKVRFHRYGVIF